VHRFTVSVRLCFREGCIRRLLILLDLRQVPQYHGKKTSVSAFCGCWRPVGVDGIGVMVRGSGEAMCLTARVEGMRSMELLCASRWN